LDIAALADVRELMRHLRAQYRERPIRRYAAGLKPISKIVVAKMALDVIKPLVYDERVFTRVNIPGEDEVDLEREVDSSARPDWAKILAE
jgi:hypothetical protein